MNAPRPYLRKQFGFFPAGRRPEWLPELSPVCETPIGLLCAGDNLPVAVLEAGGRPSGIWLGWPIHRSGAPGPDAGLEEWIYGHAGSFIYVDFSAAEPRVFLDACASLSLVFDRRSGITASTAWVALGPDEYRARHLPDQLVTYDVERHGWIPGGETAHADVERIMANFALLPLSGRAERHWSYDRLPAGEDDAAHLCAIAAECRGTLSHLLDRSPVAQSLTAGNESRLLLATLKDRAPEARFFTVSAPWTRMDVDISARLAERFALDWREMPVDRASPERQARWRATVGDCLTGANLVQHPTVDALGRTVFVGGLGGEIGRAFLWRNWPETAAAPTPADLARRLKLPMSDRLEANLARWLTTLPAGIDPISIYELAYIELRMACWAFAQSYADPDLIPIAPLISRASFSHMLSLSFAVRRTQTMPKLIVEREWPELLAVPVNRYGDPRDATAKLAKVASAIRSRIRF